MKIQAPIHTKETSVTFIYCKYGNFSTRPTPVAPRWNNKTFLKPTMFLFFFSYFNRTKLFFSYYYVFPSPKRTTCVLHMGTFDILDWTFLKTVSPHGSSLQTDCSETWLQWMKPESQTVTESGKTVTSTHYSWFFPSSTKNRCPYWAWCSIVEIHRARFYNLWALMFWCNLIHDSCYLARFIS